MALDLVRVVTIIVLFSQTWKSTEHGVPFLTFSSQLIYIHR